MTFVDQEVRQHFNRVAKEQHDGSYEDRRWNNNPRVKEQYRSTKAFIEGKVVPLIKNAKHVMELGPGPGTWTRIIAASASEARFTLMDISSEMLERAHAGLPESIVVETREGEFLATQTNDIEGDFFFSSRALEYVNDKKIAVNKIDNMISSGGYGCIITKMPKPIANLLSGRTPSAIHQGQVNPKILAQIIREEGLINVRLYPVTFGVPLLSSAFADKLAAKVFSNFQLNPISAFFAESYGVIFQKP